MSIYETLNERANTHGDFEQGADVFAQFFELLSKNKENLTKAQLYAVNMILAKLVRILKGNANEKDHWQDIIGYCTLALNSMSDKSQPVNPYVETKLKHTRTAGGVYIGAEAEAEIAMALNNMIKKCSRGANDK